MLTQPDADLSESVSLVKTLKITQGVTRSMTARRPVCLLGFLSLGQLRSCHLLRLVPIA